MTDSSSGKESGSEESVVLKRDQIRDACSKGDLDALSRLATSPAGLVDDQLRCIAWPILLGNSCKSEPSGDIKPWADLPPHREEDQVKLDVNRSFVYYPRNQSDEQLEARKQELLHLITEVLRRHPMLNYFQGYHDIVQVLLLVLGPQAATPAVASLSLLRIRDFMLPTLTAALSHLRLLPAILGRADLALSQHLAPIQPFFALASTLTLYAHDIEEYGDIARLFDFILASEAVMPVYLFAVIILQRKDELLDIPPDEPDMMHFMLTKLPKPLDLELLMSETKSLFARYPPDTLPNRAWSRISSYSVLKTTRDPQSLARQTLQQGEEYFEFHAAQVRREQQMQAIVAEVRKQIWLYRRPVLVTVTVAVGFVALWMGRDGGSGAMHGLWSWAYRGFAASVMGRR
ncbi:hypothetical protein K402DRAFT_388183 [Aulographum hederae CBS 113979]|uniref:Rab-GAP TBC domain-containing protein n=1 Tax=Aulographum hederae CBS 113979 TaxID=1176131 RepID=A0A6G1HHM8_9PEZI|nr:hypothetical protein K402DRAFT_388183 [Aulographum hederae CBS 113979]